MRLKSIQVQNFRLLKDVKISLEDHATVVVGRNNSGKTSLAELFRRLLTDIKPSFSVEDFTLSRHEDFWSAFILHSQGSEEATIRAKLPFIEVLLSFDYAIDDPDLGLLSEFIIDLEVTSTSTQARIRYELQKGRLEPFFEGITYSSEADEVQQRKAFFKIMKERIPQFYSNSFMAIDPTDESNQKILEGPKLKALIQPGFINAQRRLDDVTGREKEVLGKILERILSTAKSEAATPEDHTTAQALESAVKDIQEKMNADFNKQLNKLLPALGRFNYPGLNDPQIHTETVLDVQRLLENHTKLNYEGANGIGLPEGYNGLGTRNLIYILFQLFEFFKSFQASIPAPGVHLVFIEEPEAHLHPQMQEVFIRKIQAIAESFSEYLGEGKTWPVQFIVTTHSSHVANEAPFEAIRYFFCTPKDGRHTIVKDLRDGLNGAGIGQDKEFLHKYLTLTRCDLFFADKAMLIEGPTERLLMPRMIEIVDNDPANDCQLSSQYLSVIEVGGAFAHHFLNLLKFLDLKTLIITDIDATKAVTKNGRTNYKKCKLAEGTHTSNACLKTWFNDSVTPEQLINKQDKEKLRDVIRIAYQIPESIPGPCGRSFEDAFMLANPALFAIQGDTDDAKADDAWNKVEKIGKTDFALEYAIDKVNWLVPRYIKEGLLWLARSSAASNESVAKEILGQDNAKREL